MEIQSIDHIAINVSDIERSKDFYCNLLGFSYMNKVDCGDFDIHYLQLPGKSRLEMFDYRGVDTRVSNNEQDIGLRHLAFKVKDVKYHEDVLISAGVEITLACSDLHNLGARVILFRDPNGITIEFCESL